MNIEELKTIAFDAKTRYKMGAIGREEAKSLIDPFIEAFNQRSKEIAKKYNQKPKTISFITYLRSSH